MEALKALDREICALHPQLGLVMQKNAPKMAVKTMMGGRAAEY